MSRKLGKYRVIKTLGKGGNGIVYLVRLGNNKLALKTLKDFSKTNAYARFKDEIKALNQIGNVPGIINIVDHYIPEVPNKLNPPYYVMPIGIPFEKYMVGKSHEELYKALIKITEAVIHLHGLNFTHRDIKPSNMMFVNDQPVLTDFGLVSFPDKSGLSKPNERIGPAWTIDPEMKRNSSTAEFKMADIYSLAKTMWILITGKQFGFEGQYIPNSSISLNNFVDLKINSMTNAGEWYYFSVVLLDKLLEISTNNDPTKRPTAFNFHKMLSFWFESNDDFSLRNIYEWENALEIIFPLGSPIICEWTEPTQILSVLETLTNYDSLNYFFYPTYGGNSMSKIEYNPISNNFILDGTLIFAIDKLIFRSLGKVGWSYFRIVVKDLQPYTTTARSHEEEYRADENFNFIGELSDEIDTKYKTFEVNRFFRGSFIIVRKTSTINNMKGTYKSHHLDGHHAVQEKFSYDEYHHILDLYMNNKFTY